MKYRTTITRAAAAILFAVVLLTAPLALAVNPQLSHLMPRGGQRGTEVPVKFTGSALDDAVGLVFHATGVSFKDLEVVDANTVTATLVLAEDCPLGTQPLRIHTRTGVSNLQLFSVGAMREVEEVEPNHPVENATPVEWNTTINGVITAEDVDYYALALTAGQRVAVEVEGLRLGKSLFDPKLRFFDPSGTELFAEDDTVLFRQDPGFNFVAEQEGRYILAISDASYGGGGDYVYRLHIGDFPRPFSVTPLGGAPGETVELRWLGDPALATQELVVPARAPGTWTVPIATESGYAPTKMPFRILDLPGVLETEPNNTPEEATPGSVPGAFHGVISEAGEIDYFSFPATNGQTWDVRVWARELGSPLDSVLTIYAPSGGVAASDDDGAGIDSATRLSVGEDGNYVFAVEDHLKRGGENFAYRVEITEVSPHLTTRVLENRPASITVPQDNQSYLLVNVTRRDFDAPIRLDMLGLPEGVGAAAEILPAGQSTMPVILTATPDAPVAAALVQVQGVQTETETPVTGDLDQEVVLIYGRNETTFFGQRVDRLAAAVSEAAPFKVELAAPQMPLVHGGARMLTVSATRAEGFTGPIELRFPWLPAGMSGGTAQIPEGQNSAEIRLEIQAGAAVRVHQVFVAANAAGYELCTPFIPIEVQEPWVQFALAATETDQGKPGELVVEVTHREAFEGAFPVHLQGLPRDVSTVPQELTKDVLELRFPLTVTEDAPTGKFEGLLLQTDLIVNNEPISHSAGGGLLTIHTPLPPELQAPAAPAPAPEDPAVEAPARKTRFPSG